MSLKKKLLIIIPSVLVGILLILYIIGVVYYSSRYLPETYIEGIEAANLLPEDVLPQIHLPLEGTLTITNRDGVSETVDLAPLSFEEKVELSDLQDVKGRQINLLWFVEQFYPKYYTVPHNISYDEAVLNELTVSLGLVSGDDVVKPQDAYIEEDDDGFHLVPEVAGNQLKAEQLPQLILDTVRSGQSQLNLSDPALYYDPEVTSDDPEMNAFMEQVGFLNDLKITYDFGDRQEVLGYSGFKDWIDLEDISLGLSYDEVKAREYVEKMAEKYDTYKTTRKFQSTNKGEIEVGGGIYGWKMDVNTTTSRLLEMLQEGKPQEVEPAYYIYGYTRDENDIGDTYVEINLSEQYMWYYVDGELYLETSIVSGLPDGERNTPTGVFYVWSKESDRYLEGDDYKLWVDYWMPIDWTGVGIHDATWQPTFGGTNYLVRGSHGCINTPPAKCGILYDHIEIGTPVVVYAVA